MKKKIFGILAILTIAVIVAFNVNMKTSNPTSLLALANVEALADGETGTGARTCSLTWKVTILGVGVEKSCSVTCDPGYNAVCKLKNVNVFQFKKKSAM